MLVDSRDPTQQTAGEFMDAILSGLLTAQAMWLATRDPAALRRQLLALLTAVG